MVRKTLVISGLRFLTSIVIPVSLTVTNNIVSDRIVSKRIHKVFICLTRMDRFGKR